MAKNNNLTDFLTGIANAIRTKKGTTGLINPQNFEEEIAGISVGIEDVFTAAEMTALLTEANIGKIYRFTGTTDSTYTNGDLYEVIKFGTGTLRFRHYTVLSPLSISYALTNCTADSTNPTEIVKGKTYDFGFTANSGYEFPSSGTTSVTGGTIVSWDYPDASDLTKITVAIEVTGDLTITQNALLQQLATPQNVSANGTTVSWDEVENAEVYVIYADGIEIGISTILTVSSEYTTASENTIIKG